MRYELTWEHLGRRSAPPGAFLEADDADQVAEQVHRIARSYLLTNHYLVAVEIDTGLGYLFSEGHTLGRFALRERPLQVGP